jgi:D-alanyl-D-alanine carboxypeptidase
MLEPSVRSPLSFRLAALGTLLAALLAMLVAVAPAEAAPLSKADQEFVDKTVEAGMKENNTPGMSISITGPAGEYTKAYGRKNSSTALSLADHMRAGSITKSFTAIAVLKQIEEGSLAFTDTVDEFVSEIPNGSSITVRHLLSMRSGVYEYTQDATFKANFALNPNMKFGPWDAVAIMRKHPANFTPGTKTEYTNSNYVLLGLILEAVSGETAPAAITKDVIEAAGLEQTSFPSTSALPAPYSEGHNLLFYPVVYLTTSMNPNITWTSGAIISTTGDLQKFAVALGTGTLLSPEMFEEQQQYCPLPYSYEGPSQFGYGLGLISFGDWIGHNGSVPGYEAEAFYEPASGASIAGMANLQSSKLTVFSKVFENIAAHLYPGSMETPEYPVC